ncbi:MAG: RNB domain-containing ribonuclease [Candidatus Micrarchaeota archaeon]|nr:RNB domain-containing ribonuclease [Candidatus Micrarchaeota archaeon]
MEKYGFESSFSKEVMAAVGQLDASAPQKAKSVRDTRGLLWSSIDNFDTEDLDQIEYCERGGNGEINVKVGIADVDAYVPKDGTIDLFAQANTISVYTGVQTFPMFPDRLSKDLSSLPPNQDRLALVIEYSVMPDGRVKPGEVYRAVVRNKAKLVYEEVGAWLENRGPMPKLIADSKELEAQIRLQDEASEKLGQYRAGQGALALRTLQARAVIKDEKVLDLVLVEEDKAKRIIENFMIGANGVTSSLLEDTGMPTIQRIVRTPKYWDEIVDLAKEKGTKLPRMPSAKALSVFLDVEKQKDPERFPDLSLAIVKLLGPGEYVMYDKKNPIGHFCLAVSHYTHSTAPNRRYVDLIIQRMLKAYLEKRPSPYGKKELGVAAEWCTDREQAAKRVERFMVKAEAAQLLQGRIGQTFDAMITGASDKGVYARIFEPPVEGKIVSRVKNVHVGQKVRVRLIDLDPQNGFIDFELAR